MMHDPGGVHRVSPGLPFYEAQNTACVSPSLWHRQPDAPSDIISSFGHGSDLGARSHGEFQVLQCGYVPPSSSGCLRGGEVPRVHNCGDKGRRGVRHKHHPEDAESHRRGCAGVFFLCFQFCDDIRSPRVCTHTLVNGAVTLRSMLGLEYVVLVRA